MAESLAMKPADQTARSTLREVIRYVGLAIFVIGLARLVVLTPRFADLMEEAWPLRHRFAVVASEAFPPLNLSALGAAVYVLSTISRVGSSRRTLNARIGGHLLREPIAWHVCRVMIGTILLVVCLPIGAYSSGMWRNLVSGRYPESIPILIVVAPATTAIALLLLNISLRFVSRRGERVLHGERRRPFLYLRSFRQDARVVDRGRGIEFWLSLLLGGRLQTSERRLGLAVADLGPLIAVGQPGEKLPPLGASRLYVGDQWQDVVADLVAASQLVVVRIGQTDGFWWEMKHLLKSCDPRKVVIYLPKQDRGRRYTDFRLSAREVFPHEIPVRPGKAIFLGFGDDWMPRLIMPTGWSLRSILVGAVPRIRGGLNRALSNRGMTPRRLPFLGREWALMAIFTIWLVFTVIKSINSSTPMMPDIYEHF